MRYFWLMMLSVLNVLFGGLSAVHEAQCNIQCNSIVDEVRNIHLPLQQLLLTTIYMSRLLIWTKEIWTDVNSKQTNVQAQVM